MSLRRNINKGLKDPVLAKILKSYTWQKSVVGDIDEVYTTPDRTACHFKKSSDGKVNYDDINHIYYTYQDNIRIPIISVTTLLGAFKPPFNVDEMSMHCANNIDYETNCLEKPFDWEALSVKERAKLIKNAWSRNNKEATEYGSFTHACLEHRGKNPTMTTQKVYNQMRERYGLDYNVIISFINSFISSWYNPKFKKLGEILYESIVYDLDIMIAGQSDIVILDHKNKLVYIIDYKTNKDKPGSEKDKSYSSLQYPLSHIKSNDLVIYQLQLCLYQAFLCKQLGYGYGINVLLWANRDTGELEPIYVDPRDHAQEVRIIYRYMLKIKKEL